MVQRVPRNPATSGADKRSVLGKFFDTYYDRTYTLDIPLLKTYLLNAWNTFARNNPRIVESTPGTVACPKPSFKIIAHRHAAKSTDLDLSGDGFLVVVLLRLSFTRDRGDLSEQGKNAPARF